MTDFRPATIYNIRLGAGQCLALPGYKLGIAVKNRERAKHHCDEIMNRIVDHELVQRAVNSTANCYIEFKNGSTIDIFAASDNARGKKFDELIIETDIRQDIVWDVLAFLIMPWQYRPWRYNTRTGTKG